MRCCAYWLRDGGCGEGYEEHVDAVLKNWALMKPFYERWLRRVFGFDVVEVAIWFHDLGKLAAAYKSGSGRYRHEVLGAYLAYKVLGGEVRYYVSAAVALHHEPIIMGAYVGELGERSLNVSTLLAMLRGSDLAMYCNYSPAEELLKRAVEIWRRGIEASDVVAVFGEVLAFLTAGPASERRRKRLLVAGILQPLVVADSVAAMMNRGGSGTKIARTAVSGAEPGLLRISADQPTKL